MSTESDFASQHPAPQRERDQPDPQQPRPRAQPSPQQQNLPPQRGPQPPDEDTATGGSPG